MTLRVADFDFELPEELVAQHPAAERGDSRLLVLSRSSGAMTHSRFERIGDFLREGDLLVLNNTRVFAARLFGHRLPSGGAVECLLLGQRPAQEHPLASSPSGPATGIVTGVESSTWDALVHPGQKLKPGAQILFERDGVELHGEVLGRHFHGRRTVRLWTTGGRSVAAAVDAIGHVPLPPYIHRDDTTQDRERYQTVYAQERGSVAAPTAGLHFTDRILADLDERGVERVEVTLHIGYGTFKPVRVERVEDHVVDPETFAVGETAAAAITRALRERRRIIAVGTSTVRTLESLNADAHGVVRPAAGETALFIHPGHDFRIVSGLVTNFHLPRSSLLMLVSAFAGRDRVLTAYRDAIAQPYRFYSYGDAMLIL
ncbi:MAG: tRNA preQ1(34) S-adenosylmethionine ribosyltransferase-isomerase QueA [Vicinamibacterales bacterium]